MRSPALGFPPLLRTILFVLVGVASVLCEGTGIPLLAAADAKFDAIAHVLDTYAAGRYDEALSDLRTERNFRTLSKDFRGQAPKWIAIAPREARDRRQRVVAVVALEAALVGFSKQAPDQFQRIDALGVIEFGCDLLRHGAPSAFEHLWMLASVALIQGAKNFGPDSNDLFERAERARVNNPIFRATNHYRHAFARFPTEARFPLAELLSRAEARRMPNRSGATALSMTTGVKFGPPGDEEEAAHHVETSIKNLTAIVNNRGTEAEVRLRRGILLFHRNELTASLADARAAVDAAPANDPYVVFVAHMYIGLALDSLERRIEAMEAYKAALRIVPRARSVVLTLAADLFVTGQHEEAASLLQTTFREPAPPDPWRLFSAGDYRFWADDLSRLREALHP